MRRSGLYYRACAEREWRDAFGVNDRYSETWSEYRKWRNRAWLAAWGFLPQKLLISLVLRAFPSSAIADYVCAACGMASILVVFVVGRICVEVVVSQQCSFGPKVCALWAAEVC